VLEEIAMNKAWSTILLFALVGCADPKINVTAAQALGVLVGGGSGGIIGAQFGRGDGQIFYATVGTLVGAGAGYKIAPRLLPSDRAFYDRSTQRAWAEAADGEMVSWSNPETGVSGIVRPVASYRTGHGELCRQYRVAVVFRGGVEAGEGTACRQPDGGWAKLADRFG
jgi:surface antigen